MKTADELIQSLLLEMQSTGSPYTQISVSVPSNEVGGSAQVVLNVFMDNYLADGEKIDVVPFDDIVRGLQLVAEETKTEEASE